MGLGNIVKSVVGGVDDALGGYGAEILGGAASAFGAYQQQQASKDMAKDQMKFQERMSSTAHQRQVADLKKAGLNPILSANKGASSPGGAMGVAQNVAGSAAQTALSMAQAKANINATNAQADLSKAQAGAITPISQTGKEIGSLWEWLKDKTGGTAKKLQGLIDQYYREKSEVTGSKKGNSPGKGLIIEIN